MALRASIAGRERARRPACLGGPGRADEEQSGRPAEHLVPDQSAARFLQPQGADRANRASTRRLAARCAQGADRQRAGRLRGSRDRARDQPFASTRTGSPSATTALACRRRWSRASSTSASASVPARHMSRPTAVRRATRSRRSWRCRSSSTARPAGSRSTPAAFATRSPLPSIRSASSRSSDTSAATDL